MKLPKPPAQVRIIGGHWRRSLLPVADRPGLRPTPDRLRETLFNWLGDVSGLTLLDAFAGSGALGLEAASRGAARVTLLERDPLLVRSLQTTLSRLTPPPGTQVQIQRGDALAWSPSAPLDGVFLDPPFDADIFALTLQRATAWLAPGAWVYLEAPAEWTAWPPGLERIKHARVGQVHGQVAVWQG
ncbi:16S rRNA (guanine(966)-N(2))-methyltransferase RsmD [Amphibiibacter pelophylacis]|uniref:16S rRNA (Guanine(966)-N(2))-methyltransferase RsmD n=1 Tax=Amphibiibacter pelophylacis TaxID=1799477 RepID=A0ACC6P1V9_9BURK